MFSLFLACVAHEIVNPNNKMSKILFILYLAGAAHVSVHPNNKMPKIFSVSIWLV